MASKGNSFSRKLAELIQPGNESVHLFLAAFALVNGCNRQRGASVDKEIVKVWNRLGCLHDPLLWPKKLQDATQRRQQPFSKRANQFVFCRLQE